MKRTIKISALFLILMLSGLRNMCAQNFVPSTFAGRGIDSVTLGSLMAYRIAPDSIIASLVRIGAMNPSVYNWLFSDSTTVLQVNGSPAIADSNGFYPDTVIGAVFNKTYGILSLQVAEKSNPNGGLGCISQTTQSLTIQTLPRPTINFTGNPQANGACSETDFNIPLKLTGYGPWSVDYTITYDSTAPVAFNQMIGGAGNAVGMTQITTLTLNITAAQLSNGFGTYKIIITNVRDRISLKSLDQTLIAAHAADLPTVNAYIITIYPSPGTKPIKHILNK